MCGELKDWISEKQSVLGNEDLGKDLRSVQALQRKHQVILYIKKISTTVTKIVGEKTV